MKAIATFALLAALQFACGAQEKPQIKVTVTTPTPVAQTGRDIRIDIAVANVSDHTIRIMKALGPDGQAEAVNRVEVYDAGGKKLSWLNRSQGWISRKTLPIEPGNSSDDVLILGKLFDLSVPGKYTVVVEHELMQRDAPRPADRRFFVASNTLQIVVTE